MACCSGFKLGFLRIGVIFAVLYNIGKCPCENEILARCCTISEKARGHDCVSVEGKASAGDSLILVSLISFVTSIGVTGEKLQRVCPVCG